MHDAPSLNRVLSLPVLTLYGLGTTVGAGIYALVGEVAGEAGTAAPFAFVVAAAMASLTALSFCELSSRLPRAGGEAVFVAEGLRSPRLATIVGLLVAAAGCVSAATVARGFAGYLGDVVDVAPPLAIVGMLLVLGGLAAWGIREAAWAAAVMTVVEIGGLGVVVWAGAGSLGELPERWPELLPPLEADALFGVGAAALLCFYAFLGFEDMVNVAEEVKAVRRALPRAIIVTLAVTSVIYLAVTVVLVLALPPAELAAQEAPLSYAFRRLADAPAWPISLIGIVAMTNGALIQLIKASRLLYGLAQQGRIPDLFARLSPRRRTPVLGTAVVTGATVVLALFVQTGPLAAATSALTLVVFALANLALVGIKRREPAPPGVVEVPLAVPWLGFAISGAFVVFELARRLQGLGPTH